VCVCVCVFVCCVVCVCACACVVCDCYASGWGAEATVFVFGHAVQPPKVAEVLRRTAGHPGRCIFTHCVPRDCWIDDDDPPSVPAFHTFQPPGPSVFQTSLTSLRSTTTSSSFVAPLKHVHADEVLHALVLHQEGHGRLPPVGDCRLQGLAADQQQVSSCMNSCMN
jgi:hypothetical protein